MTKKVTRVDALNTAIAALSDNTDVAEVLMKIRDTIAASNAHKSSDAAKEKANEKRKAKTTAKRAEFLNGIVPIVRKGITTTPQTDKEIFAAVEKELPDGITLAKVRYMLVHGEIGEDIVKIDCGKNPNQYVMKIKEEG